MAGDAKILVLPQAPFEGPTTVARSESLIEMGVRYEPGVPSPMESVLSKPPIVVDGNMVLTGGGALGFPKQFIKLSASYAAAPCQPEPRRARARGCGASAPRLADAPRHCCCRRDPTPLSCTYSGLRFVSQQALDHAARMQK